MYLSVHQRERCQLEFQTFLTRLPDIGALSVLCCAVLCCAVLCCAPLLQSCLIPCFPMDYSTPGSSVHGILQQEYWSGFSCTPPGDLPNPGIKCGSPAQQTDSLPLRHWESPLVPSTHHRTEKDKSDTRKFMRVMTKKQHLLVQTYKLIFLIFSDLFPLLFNAFNLPSH